jgi:hypothetical protein
MFSDDAISAASDAHSTNRSYWTITRKELLAWFNRNAPSLAELYDGAVRLLFDAPTPGRVRFIAHAIREIRNRLPDVIAGPQKFPRLDYKSRLDRLVKIWEISGYGLDESLPNLNTSIDVDSSSVPDISIPRNLFLEVSRLVTDHKITRSKPLDTAVRLFEALAPENKTVRDTFRPIFSQWLNVTDWFVDRAHDSGKTDSMYDLPELETKFGLFETCLGALVRSFFSTIEELDEILEDANS